MATKAPNPTDRHVGSRVRMRRLMLSMSQEKLGDALGLAFQQVQKYEKGTNRIGASRLAQIGAALQVAPAFFFEGAPGVGDHGSPRLSEVMTKFFGTTEGVAFAKAFLSLEPPVRRKVVMLVQNVASTFKTAHDEATES